LLVETPITSAQSQKSLKFDSEPSSFAVHTSWHPST
jgi:hypothetical protein